MGAMTTPPQASIQGLTSTRATTTEQTFVPRTNAGDVNPIPLFVIQPHLHTCVDVTVGLIG